MGQMSQHYTSAGEAGAGWLSDPAAVLAPALPDVPPPIPSVPPPEALEPPPAPAPVPASPVPAVPPSTAGLTMEQVLALGSSGARAKPAAPVQPPAASPAPAPQAAVPRPAPAPVAPRVAEVVPPAATQRPAAPLGGAFNLELVPMDDRASREAARDFTDDADRGPGGLGDVRKPEKPKGFWQRCKDMLGGDEK